MGLDYPVFNPQPGIRQTEQVSVPDFSKTETISDILDKFLKGQTDNLNANANSMQANTQRTIEERKAAQAQAIANALSSGGGQAPDTAQNQTTGGGVPMFDTIAKLRANQSGMNEGVSAGMAVGGMPTMGMPAAISAPMTQSFAMGPAQTPQVNAPSAVSSLSDKADELDRQAARVAGLPGGEEAANRLRERSQSIRTLIQTASNSQVEHQDRTRGQDMTANTAALGRTATASKDALDMGADVSAEEIARATGMPLADAQRYKAAASGGPAFGKTPGGAEIMTQRGKTTAVGANPYGEDAMAAKREQAIFQAQLVAANRVPKTPAEPALWIGPDGNVAALQWNGQAHIDTKTGAAVDITQYRKDPTVVQQARMNTQQFNSQVKLRASVNSDKVVATFNPKFDAANNVIGALGSGSPVVLDNALVHNLNILEGGGKQGMAQQIAKLVGSESTWGAISAKLTKLGTPLILSDQLRGELLRGTLETLKVVGKSHLEYVNKGLEPAMRREASALGMSADEPLSMVDLNKARARQLMNLRVTFGKNGKILKVKPPTDDELPPALQQEIQNQNTPAADASGTAPATGRPDLTHLGQ